MRKSPLAPLCQRGVIPPFSMFSLPKVGKGRLEGILQINAVIIMRLLIKSLSSIGSAAPKIKFTKGSVF